MLTYYPEVAAVGNLADALSQAFAQLGSSLTAFSPVPPEEPIWSIFSDHPDAPGTTVPETARITAPDGRTCQAEIGCGLVPLGTFLFDFFDDEDLSDFQGWLEALVLTSPVRVIQRAFEQGDDLDEVSRELGLVFHRRPEPSPETIKSRQREARGMAVRALEKLVDVPDKLGRRFVEAESDEGRRAVLQELMEAQSDEERRSTLQTILDAMPSTGSTESGPSASNKLKDT
jgi:hypothetical protein